MPAPGVTTSQRNYLQPFHVFTTELSRLNQVYWTSRYALERFPAILKAIATTASKSEDPPVLTLWPSEDTKMRRNLTIPLSKYSENAAATIESIRAIAVVGICSAFENALVNYFVLACHYLPKKVLTGWNYGSVPKILKNEEAYARLQKRSVEKAAEVLRAGYGTRVHVLLDSFGADRTDLRLPSELETYYRRRHLVAHNQGVEEDGPWLPPDELANARVAFSEEAWRQMLGDFDELVTQLDGFMQTVVPHRAIHLAVHWTMEHTKNAPMTLGVLRNRANVAWHLHEPTKAIEQAAIDIGYQVSREKHPIRRRVTNK